MSIPFSEIGAAVDVQVQLVVGVAIAFGFAALVSFIPLFRNSKALCGLSIAAAVVCHQAAFVGFALINAASYGALFWLQERPDKKRRWHYACLAIVCLALVLSLGRIDHWERLTWPGRTSMALYVADMWLVLRLVTIFWEVGSGRIKLPSIERYIIWTCLPFTLIGPVFRYSQMPASLEVNRQFWKSSGWWRDMAAGGAKLAAGFAIPVVHLFETWALPHSHFASALCGALITGPLSFYLVWAGYFNLMEVAAKPLSCKLSASFNFPIGRENISAFWANWNMTATAVFRDYLFYNRWGMRSYNVYFNTVLLFALVGLWHETNAYWLVWGLLHAFLFSTYLVWRKYRTGWTLPLQGTPAARISARVLTYVCVCACWYLPSKILLSVLPRFMKLI